MMARLAGFAALAAGGFILYFPSAGSFWLYDDPALLRQVVQHSPWEYFFLPEVWRLSSASNFTPWVLLSFDMDLSLWGLRPFGFYLHQVVSICVLAAVAYAVLGRWFSSGACFMGLSLFLVSPPLAESAQLLMERHYVEGLLFSLASIHFFMESESRRSVFHGILGSFLYLAAALSKEIYVPLPFLLLFMTGSSWRGRARYALPWFVLFLVYVLWRHFMLGRLTGGYGLDLAWPMDYILFPARVVTAMGGGTEAAWWKWLIAASSAGMLLLIFKTDRKRLYPALAVAVMIAAPIVLVSPIMATRYVWLLFFGWLVLHMMAWDGLTRNGGRLSSYAVLVWCVVLACSFLYVSLHGPLREHIVKRQTAEGRFVLLHGADSDLLVKPVASGWYYSELSWLRENVLHLPPGPSVLGDDRILCFERKAAAGSGSLGARFTDVWQFDASRGVLIREDTGAYAAEDCGGSTDGGIRTEAPLSLRIAYLDSTVSWKLGPYRKGEYALFLGRTSESLFPLPAEGTRFVSFRGQTVYFRLRYVSPEGWMTFSPLLKLQVGDDDRGSLVWERRA